MSTPPTSKRCLYEVLGVGRDASNDEIRSAYRRLALQLHPDKAKATASSPAAATAAFQELVNAYEVLSDPKERSYYDSHRSQILFSSSSSSSSSSSTPSGVDLFAFFSSSVYSGFSDTGRGFYKVYADVFDSVYRQETRFQAHMGLPEDSVPPAPLMGNLESPYPQVTAFYAYWMGFCTVMDFAWADIYNAGAGENRRSRRAMEEENRKVRKKARREYNDLVRALAEFVKKRDKRVVEMALKRKEEEERRKEEERERRKDEERRKKERASLYQEPEWARTLVEEEDLFEDGRKDSDCEDHRESEELYCVACGKKFKSEKQWKNHEQSKKHKEKVAELREAMLEEDEKEKSDMAGGDVEENGDEEEDEDGEVIRDGDHDEEGVTMKANHTTVPHNSDDKNDMVNAFCEELDKGLRVEEEGEDAVASSGLSDQYDEEESILEAMVSGQRSRNGFPMHQSDVSSSKVVHGYDESDEDGSMVYDNVKKGRRSRAKRKGGKGNADVTMPNKDATEINKDGNGPEREDGGAKDMTSSARSGDAKGRSNSNDHSTGKNQKTKQQQIDGRAAGKGRKNKGTSKLGNLCETCGESFETRNKLFMHLGDTGHATLKSR